MRAFKLNVIMMEPYQNLKILFILSGYPVCVYSTVSRVPSKQFSMVETVCGYRARSKVMH